jgi:hypothetical protein
VSASRFSRAADLVAGHALVGELRGAAAADRVARRHCGPPARMQALVAAIDFTHFERRRRLAVVELLLEQEPPHLGFEPLVPGAAGEILGDPFDGCGVSPPSVDPLERPAWAAFPGLAGRAFTHGDTSIRGYGNEGQRSRLCYLLATGCTKDQRADSLIFATQHGFVQITSRSLKSRHRRMVTGAKPVASV